MRLRDADAFVRCVAFGAPTPAPTRTKAPTTPRPSLAPTHSLAPTTACVCDQTLDLEIGTDEFPGETTWTLVSSPTMDSPQCVPTQAAGGPYSDPFTVYTETVTTQICAGQEYTFTIKDSWGDGVCCDYGEGHYALRLGGVEIATGGDFGSEQKVVFTAPSSPPPTPRPTRAPTAAPTTLAPTQPVGADAPSWAKQMLSKLDTLTEMLTEYFETAAVAPTEPPTVAPTRSPTRSPTPRPTQAATVWTTFAHLQIGKDGYLGSFKDAPHYDGQYFMERLPSTAKTTTRIRATVSGSACGGTSSITFKMSSKMLKYMRDGTQATRENLVDVQVESGDVEIKPAHMMTRNGFVLYTSSKSKIYASSYPGSSWAACNKDKSLGGDETVTLEYLL